MKTKINWKKELGVNELSKKDIAVYIYFLLSLCTMCITDNSPLWGIALLTANFCISAILVSKITFETKDK